MSSRTIQIPLRREGVIVAFALVDAADAPAAIALGGWYLFRGYAMRMARLPDGRRRIEPLHRHIMGCTHKDGREVDHWDGDPLNCRRANLRIVTHAQNGQNHGGWRISSSRYRGVSWDKRRRKWNAYVCPGHRKIHLGSFDDEREAAEAASTARLRLFTHTNEDRVMA